MKRWSLLSATMLFLTSTATFAEETSENTIGPNEETLAALDSAAAPFEPEELGPVSYTHLTLPTKA